MRYVQWILIVAVLAILTTGCRTCQVAETFGITQSSAYHSEPTFSTSVTLTQK